MFGFNCKKKEKEIIALRRHIEKQEHMLDVYKRANRELTETIAKLRKPHKRKRQLGNRSGYKMVTDLEQLEMYEMWKNGRSMTDIASEFNRSNSCVGRHVRKLYEEEYNGEQMGKLHRREDRSSKEEE